MSMLKQQEPVATGATRQSYWDSSFRRTQAILAIWGVLLISGGILHQLLSKSVGQGFMLVIWLGLTGVGMLASYLITRSFLNSGALLIWSGLVLVGAVINLVLVYPLNWRGVPVAIVWHLLLAVGYFATGYFMDRRLWGLSGWGLAMILFNIGLALTTPQAPATDSDYAYSMAPLAAGSNYNQDSDLTIWTANGLLFGLTAGIPLLIAALPVWRERFNRV